MSKNKSLIFSAPAVLAPAARRMAEAELSITEHNTSVFNKINKVLIDRCTSQFGKLREALMHRDKNDPRKTDLDVAIHHEIDLFKPKIPPLDPTIMTVLNLGRVSSIGMHSLKQEDFKLLRLLVERERQKRANYQLRLQRAVYEGDFKETKALVNAGADKFSLFNQAHRDTLLHILATNKTVFQSQLADFLLDGDANRLLMVDWDGNTPLHLAAKHTNIEMVQWILKSRPNKIKTEEMDTALMNQSNNVGETPIFMALKSRRIIGTDDVNNDINIIKLLLSSGFTKINHQNEDGNTPLHTLVIHYMAELMQYLFLEIEEEIDDAMIDVFNHIYTVMEILLKKKADPNILNKDSKTLMHTIAEAFIQLWVVNSKLELVEMNEFMLMIQNTVFKVIKLLRNTSANFNLQNAFKDTPLHSLINEFASDESKGLRDIIFDKQLNDKDKEFFYLPLKAMFDWLYFSSPVGVIEPKDDEGKTAVQLLCAIAKKHKIIFKFEAGTFCEPIQSQSRKEKINSSRRSKK